MSSLQRHTLTVVKDCEESHLIVPLSLYYLRIINHAPLTLNHDCIATLRSLVEEPQLPSYIYRPIAMDACVFIKVGARLLGLTPTLIVCLSIGCGLIVTTPSWISRIGNLCRRTTVITTAFTTRDTSAEDTCHLQIYNLHLGSEISLFHFLFITFKIMFYKQGAIV